MKQTYQGDSLENPSSFYDEGNVRNRMSRVEITEDKTLVLVSRNESRLQLRFSNGDLLLQNAKNLRNQDSLTRKFEDFDTEYGFKLYRAEWSSSPDSRQSCDAIFLDSRGLLHLRSGDPSIPEATLVLKEGQVSGWLSTGEVFGKPFFYNEDAIVVKPWTAFKNAIRPLVERIHDRS